MGDFGKKLEGYRERLGIKQNALAQRIGLSPAHLNRIEKGTRKPPHVEVVLAMVEELHLKPEEAKEFVESAGYSPQVLQISGALTTTQVVPAQQSPAVVGTDGAVLQQILTQLQAVTAKLSRVEADVAELKGQRDSHDEPASSQVSHLDVEEDLETQKVKGVIRAVGGENVGSALRKFARNPRYMLYQNWHQGENVEEWEETITSVERQKGPLYLLMKGFQGITVPEIQYGGQLKEIHALGDWRAKIIDKAMEHNKERLEYFRSQVTTRGCEFRHIMPKGALDWYLEERYHSPDAWACKWKEDGNTKATYPQIALHLREVIKYLKIYDNYKIGLMDMEDCPPWVEVELYHKVHWEVKVGHAVLLENFLSGQEQDILIYQEEAVKAFANFYENLWDERRYVNTDKNDVIRILEEYAEKADELSHTTTLKAV
jgi:transcriptional regulator with XRE-family HTH domain